jgi:hypothetical protein
MISLILSKPNRIQKMKILSFIKLMIISFLFAVLLPLPLFGQNFTTAVSYMDYMNNEHRKIGEDMWKYTRAIAHGKNVKKTDTKRKELINTILTAKKNIAKMPDFEGDASLRDSMVAYLQMSYLVMNEDYSKIVDLEEIADQSYDKMEAYMTAQEKANEKMELAGKILDVQIKTFAANHKINLQENHDKLSQNLEIASEVFKYYNKIYLVFFKNYKQEAYFLNALEKNDINGMEQNKNTLLQFVQEGNKTIATVKNYKNDPSIKTACNQLLNFYQEEASVKAPILIDFYLKKENYEKTKAAFDSKQEKTRTKEDVNKMNKAVTDYNKSLGQYNLINQEIFNRRTILTDAWNNSVQSFFDTHIPKN